MKFPTVIKGLALTSHGYAGLSWHLLWLYMNWQCLCENRTEYDPKYQVIELDQIRVRLSDNLKLLIYKGYFLVRHLYLTKGNNV